MIGLNSKPRLNSKKELGIDRDFLRHPGDGGRKTANYVSNKMFLR